MIKPSKSEQQKMIRRLKRSKAYRVAYNDPDFLNSDYTRASRLQLELLKTEIGMRHNDIKSTIVVFGGTRILEPDEAQKQLKKAEERMRRKPYDKAARRDVRIATSIVWKSGLQVNLVGYCRRMLKISRLHNRGHN